MVRLAKMAKTTQKHGGGARTGPCVWRHLVVGARRRRGLIIMQLGKQHRNKPQTLNPYTLRHPSNHPKNPTNPKNLNFVNITDENDYNPVKATDLERPKEPNTP